KLQPLYEKDGTVTSANASTLGDGAAALLLADGHRAGKLGLQPVARLVSQANAAQAPEWFTTSPAKAVNLALERAGKNISDMDLIEINENFAVVGLINTELLDINPSIVNVHGGAIGLGHPLGTSGARILVTLIHALRRYNKKWGCAAVCNGGGGASAIVVECLA
ncbi:MAG: acetyl-CoA C-acetyltransferase, partial [Bacteroidota bacterium]